jgi:hypothetical protein
VSFIDGIENFLLDVFELFHSFDSLFEVRANEKSLCNFKLVNFGDLKFVDISSQAFERCHKIDE